MIEKILERLSTRENHHKDMANNKTGVLSEIDKCSHLHYAECFKEAKEIVQEVAKGYGNGWIPCSERLPESISTVLVQVKEFESPTIGWYGNMVGWRLSEKDFDELNDFTVIAWQPLPAPYQKGE